MRWTHDPETLDPLLLPNQHAVEATNLLYLSLLQIDFSQKKFVPSLAEALPTVQLIGDSLTRLTYRLRPEATWDNGRPVLARDVAFTLKLMYCPGLPNEAARAQFSFIRVCEPDTADPRRFTLICRGQAPEYAQSSGDFFILPAAALDPNDQLQRFSLAELQDRTPAALPDSVLTALSRRYQAAAPGRHPAHLPGCGPYQLIKWEKDRFLHFQRKPHWWADGLRASPLVLQAHPSNLRFVIIPDNATASLALQRGELDVYPQVPARQFAQLRRSASHAKLAFYSTSSYDIVTAGFNTRRPTLADPLTRRALSRLFDADGLLKATQAGEGQRSIGLIHPADRANYNDSLTLVPYNPNGAAMLLQQAGWQRLNAHDSWQRTGANGQLQRLELTVYYRADEAMFETVALQFRAAAAQVGIPVSLHPTEAGALTAALQRGDFDVYVRTLKGNPFIFNFAPILHSQASGKGNLTGFGTPASDQLIAAVASADSPAQKARLLRKLQTLLQQEAPLVPLFFLPTRIAAQRTLTGLHATGLKPGYAAAAIRRISTAEAQ